MKGLRAAAALEIENGSDIDATNKDGDTPLHLAARARRGKIASLLVRSGARTDISNNDGDYPLHLVAATGQVGIAVLVLAEEEDRDGVARTNNRGDTPLHVAARAVQDHMYTFLLSRGGRWDVRNGDGETPRGLYGF
jgi:ankyrin repeat protein